jgi:hypothetical protein
MTDANSDGGASKGPFIHHLVLDVTAGELRRALAEHPDDARLYVVLYDEEDSEGEPVPASGVTLDPVALCPFRDGLAILCDPAFGERFD